MRTFEEKEAVRRDTRLMIGLVGASGSGKTGSALEIAHGIQDVNGGEVFVIDTESCRALHYAGAKTFSDPSRLFKFKHIDFKAPFGPSDYLDALEHCIAKGAKTIIVDSTSHEHEGPGGVLEMHEKELDRLAGNDYGKRNKVSMLAWAKPKSERRRLINTMLQMPATFIFCFRAKEKIKMVPGKEPVQMGFMPIAGEEFVFEMTQNLLLYPASGGVPTMMTQEIGERLITKPFGPFKEILASGKPLSMATGRAMAEWAKGTAGVSKPAPNPTTVATPVTANKKMDLAGDLMKVTNMIELGSAWNGVQKVWDKLEEKDQKELTELKDQKKAEIMSAPSIVSPVNQTPL